MNYSNKNNSSNIKNFIEDNNKKQLEIQELQEKLLIKLKQLEESSVLIESLKSLNSKISKCNNNVVLSTNTNTGHNGYGYLPVLTGSQYDYPDSKLVQYGELLLLALVLLLWIMSIFFCLNRYSKLRTLYPVVTPTISNRLNNRSEPLNIEEIKIIKNEQDAIIYEKINTKKLSKSSINTTDSLISKNNVKNFNEKIKRSISERNDLILNKKNSINVTTSLNFNKNQINNQSFSDTDSTLKLNNKSLFFINKNKINKKQENLLKRRTLFANSRIKIFKAKDSLNSANFAEDVVNQKISLSLQRLEMETSKKDDSISNLDEIHLSTLQIKDKNQMHAYECVSQCTLEKIKGNLLDLHCLVKTERRPSLLQLSKISRSESYIKSNRKSLDKLSIKKRRKHKHISSSLQVTKRKKFDCDN